MVGFASFSGGRKRWILSETKTIRVGRAVGPREGVNIGWAVMSVEHLLLPLDAMPHMFHFLLVSMSR